MTKKLILALYANDIGPAKNLAAIERIALDGGHRIADVLNDQLRGKNLIDSETDALITGLSSRENGEELELGVEAKKRKIPWIVVADVHRSWARPPAKGRVSNAILLIISPSEIKEAQEFGYKQVEFVGYPTELTDIFHIQPAKIERHGKERIILVGGAKDAKVSDSMLLHTKNAMQEISGEWRLVFKSHPNEWPETRNEKRRGQILEDVELIETQACLESLLKSADISVMASGATDHIKASFIRVPIICYTDEDVDQMMIDQCGTPDWFPADKKAAAYASPDDFLQVMERLLTSEGAAEQQEYQEAAYPLPAPGKNTEKETVVFIENLLSR